MNDELSDEERRIYAWQMDLPGLGQPLIGRVLSLDLGTGTLRNIRLARDPACVVCGPLATAPGRGPEA